MPPEGVVHALTRIHRLLAAAGVLIDLHPAGTLVEAVGLGAFDQRGFRDEVAATDAGLFASVERGLYALERETTLDTVDRFDSGQELLEEARTWRGSRIPVELEQKLSRQRRPVDLRQRLVLRMLRKR